MCKEFEDIFWFHPETSMIKESSNLIGNDRCGDTANIFVYKIYITFIF